MLEVQSFSNSQKNSIKYTTQAVLNLSNIKHDLSDFIFEDTLHFYYFQERG